MFKTAEKEKVLGNMKRHGEFETLLNGISHGTSLNLHHRLLMGVSPVNGVSLQSGSSPSSPFSGGFRSSDDGSPSFAPFEEIKRQTPSTQCLNRLLVDSKSPDSRVGRNTIEFKLDELCLSEKLHRMNIINEQKDGLKISQSQIDSNWFAAADCSIGGTLPCDVENHGPFEGSNKNVSDFGRVHSSLYGSYMHFEEDMESALLGLQRGYTAGSPPGSSLRENQSNALYSELGSYENQVNYLMGRTEEQGSSYYDGRLQLQNTAVSRPYFGNALHCSQHCDMNSSMDKIVFNSHHLGHPELALSVQNSPYNHSMLNGRTRAFPKSGVPQSHLKMKGTGDIEAFTSEDSFIIPGKNLNYIVNKNSDCLRGQKKSSRNEVTPRNLRERSSEVESHSLTGGICESPKNYYPLLLQPNYSSLAELEGCIYSMAKDQHGCRFLQRIFEEGTCQDMQIIFKEIVDHSVELMMNPFGNYLVQKLLEVCNEEQRMQIVLVVTKRPGELVRISLNAHGTRSVQKLIETLKTRQQKSLVISALEPGFLDLVKDLNGNHVVQRCLQSFSNEDNKFIFDAAAKFCVQIATHRHGCCVLQRSIAHSFGRNQETLVAEISANGLLLAQDAFGNYVVQYIIELKIPSAAATLISQFEGNYVHLSMQKFSSHVVEKCLKCFEESRPRIIHELLSVSHFEQLLQDPFANYVIQSALEVTKGALRASLVEAVRPHTILRTSPYCKRIFSRNLLKK